jgi:hypothetical protein
MITPGWEFLPDHRVSPVFIGLHRTAQNGRDRSRKHRLGFTLAEHAGRILTSEPQPMPADTRYYLALDGKVAGPFGHVALREMASVNTFKPDTLCTPEGSENWQPIHAVPELAVLFPLTEKLQLKSKLIIPTSDSVTPISVEEILRGNLSADARRQSDSPALEQQPPPNPGRGRRRDYLIACALFNGIGLLALLVLHRNAFTYAFLLSYFVTSNIGLYWIYYHVMDRY